ncbi:N-acetylmuramoyl-L-alanine amidase family protein [Granulicella arctica]|uniref:N-acetylmuramoyl-L-alanine amidase n=1 Tax=Granulicella arctica TaxID=940613 RepID=A0A7Y9PJN6_9BACT|nr:N-acetylmuramoyl-L-alanine amidase [Granulicella arctica]NYF81140.1 N-acetylmuramoyl-L-alanine amidase [Granulicella arctica]
MTQPTLTPSRQQLVRRLTPSRWWQNSPTPHKIPTIWPLSVLRRHPERSEGPLYFAFVLLLGTATALAQITPPSTPYVNRNLIVLDPAHGGQDNGPTLNGQPEKNITLALSNALRTALTTRGFTVVSTRDADLPATTPLLTTDQRAGTANHLRPVACIVLHATTSGSGIHLITSSLTPSTEPYESSTTIPWDTAQTLYLSQSLHLANDLGLALLRVKIPVLLIRTALPPLDNLTCPAVAIEIAPLIASGQKNIPVTDASYQQRLADTIAAALLNWRDLTHPSPKPVTAPTAGVTP